MLTPDAQICLSTLKRKMVRKLALCQIAITSAMATLSHANIVTTPTEDGSIHVMSSSLGMAAVFAHHTVLKA